MYLLSAYQAERILKEFCNKKESAVVTLDLGKSLSEIRIKDTMFIFPDGQKIGLDALKKIIKKDTVCFSIEDNNIFPVSIFSEETNNYYKLVPTGESMWPTIEISGIRMHVTKAMSPKEDTEQKLSFVSPCIGKVLDSCTGLGYTAIMAAKTAEEVITFEKDANVIELQKINPWSAELFETKKIKRNKGDVFVEVKKLESNTFDRIIHDPPRAALATLLYSQEFYTELFRVSKNKGMLFHYTGDPGSKRGLDIRAGVIKRLEKAGFSNIRRVFNGVVAEKSN